jgi:hypothetical protein
VCILIITWATRGGILGLAGQARGITGPVLRQLMQHPVLCAAANTQHHSRDVPHWQDRMGGCTNVRYRGTIVLGRQGFECAPLNHPPIQSTHSPGDRVQVSSVGLQAGAGRGQAAVGGSCNGLTLILGSTAKHQPAKVQVHDIRTPQQQHGWFTDMAAKVDVFWWSESRWLTHARCRWRHHHL